MGFDFKSMVPALFIGLLMLCVVTAFAYSVSRLVARSDTEVVAAGIARFASKFATEQEINSLLKAVDETHFQNLTLLVVDTKAGEVYTLQNGEVAKRVPTPPVSSLIEAVLADEKMGGSNLITRRTGLCGDSMAQTVSASVRSTAIPDVLVITTSC